MRNVSIRHRKLYEDVAHHLEEMIRDGEFAESGRLPSERELMRHFGVGRPSIREALFHLRKMGLVDIRSGERARVTRPTPQFVIDAPGGGGKVPINPGYVLYHDDEKIVIRNYEGKIFEYPETGNEQVQFAPQREYHDEYLYS